MEAFLVRVYSGSDLGITPIPYLTQRNLGPAIIQEMSDTVLTLTSKQIPKLPALGHAIIPRVCLDSPELTQSHKNSTSI